MLLVERNSKQGEFARNCYLSLYSQLRKCCFIPLRAARLKGKSSIEGKWSEVARRLLSERKGRCDDRSAHATRELLERSAQFGHTVVGLPPLSSPLHERGEFYCLPQVLGSRWKAHRVGPVS